jgi:hypothetical protein
MLTEGGVSGSSPGSGGGTSCTLKHAPEPPTEDDPSDGDLDPIVFVMREVDLGDSQPNSAIPPTRFLSVGTDLDGH